MNKLKFYLIALIALVGFTFQACDDSDDYYSVGDIAIDWATVVSLSPYTYYLEGDTWGTMWPAATSIPIYNPEEGQRVIVVFNPLADNIQGFDHAVKVEDIEEVLTKEVEILTPETDEAYGNDPITINEGDMWVSGNHLNIVFIQNVPIKEKHRISLVTSVMDVDNEGYVPVQLRYNTYQDTTDLQVNGSVSFNLSKLTDLPDAKGIRLTMNSSVNGMREILLNFNEVNSLPMIE